MALFGELKQALLVVEPELLRLGGHRLSWGIARDLVIRGHVTRAELRGREGKRLLAECADAGVTVVVERESMGIKWVRFEGGKKP